MTGGAGLSVKDNQIALAGIPRWMAYDTIARRNIARAGNTVVTGGTDIVAHLSMQIILQMTGCAVVEMLLRNRCCWRHRRNAARCGCRGADCCRCRRAGCRASSRAIHVAGKAGRNYIR